MKKKVYGVYGASGFGKEVLPLVRAYLSKSQISEEHLVFVDDSLGGSGYINKYEVVSFDAFLNIKADEYYITIAIADSKIREKLTERCIEQGINILDVKAENIVQLDEVIIGEGSILCPFVTLTSNIKIGKSFHANIYSYVAHDCIIGDYVTFAPSVKCNGNIVIEDHVYIGTGAIIKQGKPNKPLKIGAGAVIGAGAFVTKDVPAGITVIGSPAVKLSKDSLRRR